MIESVADSTTKAVVFIVSFFSDNWDKIIYTFIIIIIAFILIRTFRAINTRIGKEKELSRGTVNFLNSVIKYGILFLAAINILGVYSFTYVYSLILSLGLISVVIALGSQTIISNLLGGVIVYLERPFKAGDIIKIGDNIGEVLGISFRTTAIKGLNGLNIVIPNSTFLIHADRELYAYPVLSFKGPLRDAAKYGYLKPDRRASAACRITPRHPHRPGDARIQGEHHAGEH